MTPAYALVFDTDFESGASVCDWTANGWSDSPNLAPCSGSMVMSTNQALTGTHALKLHFQTPDNTQCITACPKIYRSINSATHLYLRFGLRMDTNFSSPNGLTKLIQFRSSANTYPTVWVHY